MPGSKKDTKKEKPKKEPKILSSQVEDRIKALAKNHPAEETKKDVADQKEMHITHEEETKKVTKDTAVVTDTENANDSPVKEEEPQETAAEADTSEIPVVQSESLFARSLAPIIIGIVVGILTAGSIIYFYNSQTGESSGKITPTPSISETPTNTPAPTSIVDDLSLYDITVLNGSGISGEAARLESILQTAGFSVLEIGNAANSSFTTTIIQAKEGVPSGFIGQLQEILSKTYSVSLSSVPLAENEDTDVIITIGSLEASPASTSATPTP